MKSFIGLYIFLVSAIASAQPKFELTPQGFSPVTFTRPTMATDKLIEKTKSWAGSYNKDTYDVFEVTENSIRIDAVKENAFYYRNVGVTYYFKIVYSMTLNFGASAITAAFSVKEIYQKKTLTQSKITDYFTADGQLKEDFEEVKPSIEQTANNILKSYINFIAQ